MPRSFDFGFAYAQDDRYGAYFKQFAKQKFTEGSNDTEQGRMGNDTHRTVHALRQALALQTEIYKKKDRFPGPFFYYCNACMGRMMA